MVPRDLCSGTSGMVGHPDRACTNPEYTHLIPCCPEAAAKRNSKNMPPHSQPREGPPTDPKTSTSDHTTTHQDQKNLPQILADQSGAPHRRAEEHNPHPTMNGERTAAGRSNPLLHPSAAGSTAHYTTAEPPPSTCTNTWCSGPELPKGTCGGQKKEPARRHSSSGTGWCGSIKIISSEGEGNAGRGRGEGTRGRSGLAPPRGRQDEPRRLATTSRTQPSGLPPLNRDRR
jgi:hypothetical protein